MKKIDWDEKGSWLYFTGLLGLLWVGIAIVLNVMGMLVAEAGLLEILSSSLGIFFDGAIVSLLCLGVAKILRDKKD